MSLQALGKGNSQVRFELTYQALNPRLRVIAPWRGGTSVPAKMPWTTPPSSMAALTSRTVKSIYSRDFATSGTHTRAVLPKIPGSSRSEPSAIPNDGRPAGRARQAGYVEIDFQEGIPKRLNGEAKGPIGLVTTLNEIGGRHGVGRVDLVENRLVGMKSHGVYETPGGTILVEAHQGLEQLCLDKQTLHYKELIAHKYAELVYNGQWYTPLREALDAFVAVTQRHVTGTVRLKLYKGHIMLVGRKSPYSLYREDYATFGEEDVYNQEDAEGFIKLFGLPMKVQAMLDIEGVRRGVHEEPDYSKFKRD